MKPPFQSGDLVVYVDSEQLDHEVMKVKFCCLAQNYKHSNVLSYKDKWVVVYESEDGYDLAASVRKLTKLERALK